MESIIDETLGDVHRVYAMLFLACVAENDFVHRRQVVRQIVEVFEMLTDVIRIEYGVFGGLTDSRAVGQRVGKRAEQDAKVATIGANASDGLRAIEVERELAVLF